MLSYPAQNSVKVQPDNFFFFLTPKYSLFTERQPKEKFSHETLNFPFFNLLDLVAVVENTPVSSVGSSFFHH